jgi:AraC-like DNA-binding protein
MPEQPPGSSVFRKRPATAALRSVVLSFAERRAVLGETIVTAPLPARPDQLIEFYLRDLYAVAQDDAPPGLTPETVVVGPQSYRRTRLFLSGDVHNFTIRFQPGGFHALFGVPMPGLVNQGAAIGDVLGSAAIALRDAILHAPDFAGRVAAAEHWLAARLGDAGPVDPVARMAALLHRAGGRLPIAALARRAGLSDRQFTRRFERQVGLTPKLFARTVRLNSVLDARARSPGTGWTPLIHTAGYADQAHFVRDCRALAGDAPQSFFDEWLPGR